VSLDASLSQDSDGGTLTYEWFVYREADTYEGEVTLTSASSPVALVHIPSDAASKTVHIVLAVRDERPPPLAVYRRVIVQVSGESVGTAASDGAAVVDYFPLPESQGGWRKLNTTGEIRKVAGMDPAKLDDLKQWLLASDDRDFAAVVMRRGYLVLKSSAATAPRRTRRVASVSKAVCATVLAIASEQSQQGMTPRRMKFDDPAFDFIPWAQPLSDPRKAKITVKQLLNHTSGLCPEATGAPNDGTWDMLARAATRTHSPARDGAALTHAHHAALVCENHRRSPTNSPSRLKPPASSAASVLDGGEKSGASDARLGDAGPRPRPHRLLHVARRALGRPAGDPEMVRRANRRPHARGPKSGDALEAQPADLLPRLGVACSPDR
jgi:hypothetical protein